MRKKQVSEQLYYESFDAFKRGIDACLNDIDKKHQTQVDSLMNLRFQTFKNDQIMAG
jgi:hypothetical protein